MGGAPTAGANYFAQMSTFDPASFHQVFPAIPQSGEVPITSTSVTVPAGTLPAGGREFNLLVDIVSPGAILQDSGGIAIPDAGTGSGLAPVEREATSLGMLLLARHAWEARPDH